MFSSSLVFDAFIILSLVSFHHFEFISCGFFQVKCSFYHILEVFVLFKCMVSVYSF